MESSEIESLISNVLVKGIKQHRLTRQNISEQQNNIFKYSCDFDYTELEKLASYLKLIPEIAIIFDNKMMNTGNGSSLISIESLAKWLVITSDEKGVNNAVKQFEQYLKLKKSPAIAILAISGVDVKEPIAISDSIELVPFDSLSASSPKEALYPSFLKPEFQRELGLHFPIEGFNPPKAALVKYIDITPKSYNDEKLPLSTIDFNDLHEACEFLTLFNGLTPVPVSSWTELSDSVPCKEMLGSGWGVSTHDVISSEVIAINSFCWQEYKPLYDKFTNMSQQNRDLLRIPIQRINQARRRRNNADKAIDQGVAFEALFLNDKKHSEQISFIFRLRAALLLSDKLEKRQDLIHFFNAFYSCRSQAIHSGKLDTLIKIKHRKKVDAGELLKESDKLCIRAICKIIENGEFPDWDLLMLTVGKNDY